MSVASDFQDALERAQGTWMDEKGVVAVGQGEEAGVPTIDVWVTEIATASFPETFEGFRVRLRPTDEISAQG
jgi:hypothetical protein